MCIRDSSKGTPIIITNGLGTSRVDVRLFTPSEVVLVVLHRVETVSYTHLDVYKRQIKSL